MPKRVVQSEKGHIECRLCAILLDGAADNFDSVWLEDGQYKALISIGTMVPGWTLICPIEHDVNLAVHYHDAHLHQFVQKTLEHLQKAYGACAVFEHGAGAEDSLTGCGVGHAHLHLVPLNFPLAVEALRYAPEMNWQRCSMAEISALSSGSEYLFVANEYAGSNTTGLLAKLDKPTSQFFRRVIAGRLGMANFFDYKKYPMRDIAESSAHSLRQSVTSTLGA